MFSENVAVPSIVYSVKSPLTFGTRRRLVALKFGDQVDERNSR